MQSGVIRVLFAMVRVFKYFWARVSKIQEVATGGIGNFFNFAPQDFVVCWESFARAFGH